MARRAVAGHYDGGRHPPRSGRVGFSAALRLRCLIHPAQWDAAALSDGARKEKRGRVCTLPRRVLRPRRLKSGLLLEPIELSTHRRGHRVGACRARYV